MSEGPMTSTGAIDAGAVERPTTEPHLVERLRCRYPVGPILPNGEPEFGWRDHGGREITTTVPTRIMLEAAAEIERLRALSPTPASETSEADRADALRYRYLREHCSSHYPMTWEQPAEWAIFWEFQQMTPAEADGSFDGLIDRAIRRQGELDLEDEIDSEFARAALLAAKGESHG